MIVEKGILMKKRILLEVTFSVTVIGFFIALFISYLFTPYGGYEGVYSAFYTEAIYSLLGNRGYFFDGEILADPDIIIIEEDDFGRTMFSYVENNSINSFNYLIAQKTDNQYVYFYPDFNFISSEYNTYMQTPETVFTLDEIDGFKAINDWNLPLDESKMVRFEITNLKEIPVSTVPDDTFETLLKAVARRSNYLGDDYLYHRSEYFLTDDYGRTMYYVYGIGDDAEGTVVSPHSITQYFHAVVIIQPDGTFDVYESIMLLSNLQEYQRNLRAFKIVNRWNQPIT